MKVSPPVATTTPAKGPSALNANVLVLNKLYHPIHVTSARRAFVLLYKNDAEAITLADERLLGLSFQAWLEHSEGTTEDDDWVSTVSMSVRVPRIVRLLTYERFPIGRVNFSRKNVLARDEYRCQYCGHRASAKELTLDHVIPRSRGGKHCWTNVVAACYRCNDRKGRYTPKEAGMHLLKEPIAPKRSPEIKRKLEERKYTLWKLFLSAS